MWLKHKKKKKIHNDIGQAIQLNKQKALPPVERKRKTFKIYCYFSLASISSIEVMFKITP